MFDKFERLSKSKDEKSTIELTHNEILIIYWLLKHAYATDMIKDKE